MIKIRIEYYSDQEKDQLIAALDQFNIINVSRPYPNRPPSKASRLYIDLDLSSPPIIEGELFDTERGKKDDSNIKKIKGENTKYLDSGS